MKSTIEQHQAIEARDVVKKLLKSHALPLVKNDGYYAEYEYTPTNTHLSQQKPYKLLLDSTTPNYGGYRYWLVCESCHRKVTSLYICNDQPACRNCHNLEYGSRVFARNEEMLEFTRYIRGMKTVGRRHSYGDKTTRAGRRFQYYMGGLLDKYPVESLIRL